MSRIENTPFNSIERFYGNPILTSSPVRVMLDFVDGAESVSLDVIRKVRTELLYNAYDIFLIGDGAHPESEMAISILTLDKQDRGLLIHSGLPTYSISCAYTTLYVGVHGELKLPCDCAHCEVHQGDYLELWNSSSYQQARMNCQVKRSLL